MSATRGGNELPTHVQGLPIIYLSRKTATFLCATCGAIEITNDESTDLDDIPYAYTLRDKVSKLRCAVCDFPFSEVVGE